MNVPVATPALAAEQSFSTNHRLVPEEMVQRMSHAHPTFTEAIKEACLAATDKRSINF